MIDWINVKDRLPSRDDGNGICMDLCIVHIVFKNGHGEQQEANVYDWYDERENEWRENFSGEITHWIYAKNLPFPQINK